MAIVFIAVFADFITPYPDHVGPIGDFTAMVKFTTKGDGSLFAKCSTEKWEPDAKMLGVRGGSRAAVSNALRLSASSSISTTRARDMARASSTCGPMRAARAGDTDHDVTSAS